ncbi:MAG: hypothetical protein HYU51_15600 [Candidatus Rokubacteria bacterium]|nr:hypothetical protein [Candidatus Rokubacteria bacterium]
MNLVREALAQYVARYGADLLLDVLAGTADAAGAAQSEALEGATLRALVVAIIGEHGGPMTYGEIMEKLGGRYQLRSVQNALGYAVKQKLVTRVKPGVFKAPR